MSQPSCQPEERALVERVCRNSKVFIDTCSLLEPSYFQLEPLLFQMLKEAGQQLIVPMKIVEELKRVPSKNPALAKVADRALRHLAVQQKENLVSLKGEPGENFADNVFQTQFTRHRLNYNLTLITQDKELARDIMKLNNLESQRTRHTIEVFRVSSRGTLEANNGSTPTPASRQNAIDEEPLFELKSSLPSYSDDKIPTRHIPAEGEQVYAAVLKKSVTLTSRIGKGGEGSVYKTNVSGSVCKVYDAEKLTRFRREKLRKMLESQFSFPGICWPTDVILNNEHQIVGYLMPEARGFELQKSVFIPPLLKQRFTSWERVDLVRLAVTILEKIAYLHHHNIIIGDINPGNIIVASTKEVYFVDVDSYQIEEIPCPVGTVPFTPPELQGKNFGSLLRSRENELFAVATLLFEIMLPGKSPYAQQGGEDQGTNIRKMDFSYPLGNKTNRKTPNGAWRYCWSHLPYSIKEAFYETFRKGGDYARPESRLSANDWLGLFKDYQHLLESGKFTARDPESGLIFPQRFKNVSGKLEKCQLCGKEFGEDDLNKGYCRDCLRKGEESPCPQCGKPVVYTNYRKLVLKKPAFPLCKDCFEARNQVYSTQTCTTCGKSFTISNGEKDFYEQKGFELPRRCSSCRRQTRAQSGRNGGQTSSRQPFSWPSSQSSQESSTGGFWGDLLRKIFG